MADRKMYSIYNMERKKVAWQNVEKQKYCKISGVKSYTTQEWLRAMQLEKGN